MRYLSDPDPLTFRMAVGTAVVAGMKTVLNGPTMWPADGNHLVGPAPEWDVAPNFWLACAEWLGMHQDAPRNGCDPQKATTLVGFSMVELKESLKRSKESTEASQSNR